MLLWPLGGRGKVSRNQAFTQVPGALNGQLEVGGPSQEAVRAARLPTKSRNIIWNMEEPEEGQVTCAFRTSPNQLLI